MSHLKPAGVALVFVGGISFFASFYFAIVGNMGLAGLCFFIAIGASLLMNAAS